jgi:hypothetical protein
MMHWSGDMAINLVGGDGKSFICPAMDTPIGLKFTADSSATLARPARLSVIRYRSHLFAIWRLTEPRAESGCGHRLTHLVTRIFVCRPRPGHSPGASEQPIRPVRQPIPGHVWIYGWHGHSGSVARNGRHVARRQPAPIAWLLSNGERIKDAY